MERDLVLLFGLAFVPLALLGIVSAWADRRRPVPGLILLAMGVGTVGWAHFTHPEGGYAPAEIPTIALEMLGRFLN